MDDETAGPFPTHGGGGQAEEQEGNSREEPHPQAFAGKHEERRVQSRSYARPIELPKSTITRRYRLVALGVAVMTHLRSFDELPLTDGRNREKFGNKLHKRSQSSRRPS